MVEVEGLVGIVVEFVVVVDAGRWVVGVAVVVGMIVGMVAVGIVLGRIAVLVVEFVVVGVLRFVDVASCHCIVEIRFLPFCSCRFPGVV